jgi:hypothetical protein
MNSYNLIEEKYKANNICDFRFRNVQQISAVIGYEFCKIKGYEKLGDEEKELAEMLMCTFLNGFGLKARERQIPKSIITENSRQRFKVTFKDKTYSYFYFDGNIG